MSPEEMKEYIFSEAVLTNVLDSFEDSLDEAGFTPAQMDDIKQKLEKLSQEDLKGALSLPRETRVRYLSRYVDKPTQELVDSLVSNARKYGFTLGYHISPQDIKSGHIDGTEKDHRDNDLMRAYYSILYKNLYLKKAADNLYIIRAETGPNSSHKQDTDGSWGRASSLAIIDKLSLSATLDIVNKLVKEHLDTEDNKLAA